MATPLSSDNQQQQPKRPAKGRHKVDGTLMAQVIKFFKGAEKGGR